jgi:cell division protease FtsH
VSKQAPKPSLTPLIVIGVLLLAFWFIIKPMFFDPQVINATYSQFLSTMGEVKELQVHQDGHTIWYTFELGGQIYQTITPGNVSNIVDVLAAQGVNVEVAQPAEPMGIGMIIFLSILPILLLILFLAKMSKGGGAGGLLDFGKSKAKMIDPKSNTTRLTDVISNPGEHDEAKEIIQFIQDRERYRAARANVPTGILLAGPPGTGKTLLAKAIAGEAGVSFFTVSGSEFVEMFVGVGAARVKSVFEQARAHAPSIVFIDEIDAVGRSRGDSAGGGHREADQTLNQLLVEMDGFDKDSGVMVIAATNMPEVLDSALTRPGRFDRTIHVSLPDLDARKQILDLHLEQINRGPNIDTMRIAQGTTGMSGADLAKLVQEAAIFAARENRSTTTMNDMDMAKDKVIMGAESPKPMDEKERNLTAYHEAGHAIVGYLSPEHDPVYKVSIVPRGRALGVTQFMPDQDRYSHSLTYLNSAIATLYGGRLAEEIQFGAEAVTTGASSDIVRATELARRMVTEWGFGSLGPVNYAKTDYMGSSVFSETIQATIDEEINKILSTAQNRARELLVKNKNKLDEMARALVQHETIDQDQIADIMKGQSNDTDDQLHTDLPTVRVE